MWRLQNVRKPFSGLAPPWTPLGERTALPQTLQLVWRVAGYLLPENPTPALSAVWPQGFTPDPKYRMLGISYRNMTVWIRRVLIVAETVNRVKCGSVGRSIIRLSCVFRQCGVFQRRYRLG